MKKSLLATVVLVLFAATAMAQQLYVGSYNIRYQITTMRATATGGNSDAPSSVHR